VVELRLTPPQHRAERCSRHRYAALCLATNILIVGKLIAWRDQ
jgi:hypothetical protein